jgi:membrane-bound acyltransferase YfiQ involved in biofilm formation
MSTFLEELDGSGSDRDVATPGTIADRRLPPIAVVGVIVLGLVVVGGVYLASYLPRHAPLGPAYGLLAAAGTLLVANVAVLSRQRDLSWHHFFLVGRWALVAYLVIAGMLEYVFVYDGVRGEMLVVLSLMLLIFAIDIPLLLGFSVARYQPVDGS